VKVPTCDHGAATTDTEAVTRCACGAVNVEFVGWVRPGDLLAVVEMLRAEIDMLRGVGCSEDGDGPCGACLKCALSGQHVQSRAVGGMA
jgi:hypothetical protein